MPAIKPFELKARLESDPRVVIVDVRDPEDFRRATLPGSTNAPFDETMASRVAELVADRTRPVVFVCGWGHRAAVAAIALRREGFRDVGYLDGGLEAWGLSAQPVSAGA